MQLNQEQIIHIRNRAIHEADKYEYAQVLVSNFTYAACSVNNYELIAALGHKQSFKSETGQAFDGLDKWMRDFPKDYLFGYFTYDLKNELEALVSTHPNLTGFSGLEFFIPENLIMITSEGIVSHGEEIVSAWLNMDAVVMNKHRVSVFPQAHVSREQYIDHVSRIRQHIIEGDVYELNYCIEFGKKGVKLNPSAVFHSINSKNEAPFSGYLKFHNQYLICASPERFLHLKDNVITSQPIKGTIRRGANENEDLRRKEELKNSEKEQAENLMIVDLVRNDLARSSEVGSVKVNELFGIYTFKNLHQMISTVTSVKSENVSVLEVIKNAFPMGSMTGAPKIKSMELIEQYETTRRGLYSGCIGYFTPSRDFDFNVVIRSIQYNADNEYVSVEVGSAITYDSVPEEEYEECLLKANTIMSTLKGE